MLKCSFSAAKDSKLDLILLLLLACLLLLPAVEAAGPVGRGQATASPNSLSPDGTDCARIKITASSYQKSRSKSEFRSLPDLVRETMNRYFSKTERIPTYDWLEKVNVAPEYRHANGIFVTLSKNGKTRACWGSVYPREANLVRETVLATLGALSKEYRFKPLSRGEIKDLKIQVTEVLGLEAVKSSREVNPFVDGIFVRSGGKGGVILPGEASDAYYELVLAKLKAGIKPGEASQIYRIRAKIYD